MDTSEMYTSGVFAKMAHISLRTVRYYDKQNVLKPAYVSPEGRRYYNEQDFARLQQILLLKYLGFSLEEIRQLTIEGQDEQFFANSLELQRKLVQDQIEQLQSVEQAIVNMSEEIKSRHQINWSRMLELIHMTNMENSLQSQYQNSANISARIRLHNMFSENPQGWFPWIYEQCSLQAGMKVLEVGCGNGRLWEENLDKLPADVHIILSDISDGMIRDVRKIADFDGQRFEFLRFDCAEIPFPDASFDLVLANHTLFYCDNLETACAELSRVLKPGGHLICGTYGNWHMKEITDLVQEFDSRITLSADCLYQRFGRENGAAFLQPYFRTVEWRQYEDALNVDAPEPLIEYILSCHGNQNRYILDRYKKFRAFVSRAVGKNFHITKDAGIFLGKK